MKAKHFATLLLLSAAAAAFTSCAPRAAVSGCWRLAWHEEFSGKSFPDTACWSKIERGRSDWNNYMSGYDGCYSMRGGKIALRGMAVPNAESDTAAYITGGITTKGKKTFRDGLIEVRAKLQGARGAWPAIWMLPENTPWPYGGEIDIMERLNSDSIAYQTLHTYYTHHLGLKDDPLSHSVGAIDPDGYNTYSAVLGEDSVSLYINGRLTLAYPRIKTNFRGQFPFDRPYYLLIDMQLGGNWVGEVDPAGLPVEMLIDHVRFFQKKE